MDRRTFLGTTLLLPAAASAQQAAQPHAHHGGLTPANPSPDPFQRLQGGVPHHLTPEQIGQRSTDSPAPPGPAGRWVTRAALPIPRSEMAWSVENAGRLHVIGGYGEGRVDRGYHHVYVPAEDRWYDAAQLPRGANHVAVEALNGKVYAFGGFYEQNRNAHNNAYAYDPGANEWTPIAPMPRPRGAAAAVALNGRIHLIGGASNPTAERASIGWHEVYDPQANTWEARKALPGARDHVGSTAHEGRIHIVGGRFNTFEYNTGLHHVYLPDRDTWETRAPLPTPRSGHGLAKYRGRFFAMGGEYGLTGPQGITNGVVFGQMESYDPGTDSWQSHAAMPTPRHAVAAQTIGDWIYVAGGGAVTGGGVQSSVHEAFTLG
ncbi:Kelch repeat-containing protein [Roseomonas sp. CCTCC AB2023176]|uniref:Kelch repeat-containing protein n=1 Tax=Roseomonas sp. CCTCC AB2023176 TaxID=3342640 RepID=UPI0035DEC3BC